jgi:CRP-like cAMP-binding protein
MAERLRDLLRSNLPSAREESIAELLRDVHLSRVRAHQPVWSRGERIPLTILIGGYVGFERTIGDGRCLTVGIGYPGRLYGIASVSSTIAAVDMMALTDLEIGMWPDGALRRLVVADPPVGLDALDQLSAYVNLVTVKLEGFLHQNARGRVLRTLVRHGQLFFGDPPVLSRAHLPGLVGTTPEMTGRVLRNLEREGTIARVGRTGLVVLRQDWLEAEGADAVEDERIAPGAWPAMAAGGAGHLMARLPPG